MRTTVLLGLAVGLLGVLSGCEDPYANPPSRSGTSGQAGLAPRQAAAPNKQNPQQSIEDRLASLKFSDKYPWQLVTSKEGGYAVMMPGKPTSSTSGSGQSKTWQYEVAIGSKLICDVTHLNLNPQDVKLAGGKDGMLDRWCEGAVTSGGHVTLSRKIDVSGHPGTEQSFRGGGSANSIFCHQRCFIVGDRLFSLEWMWADGDIDDPDIQSFFDSFHLN